MSQKTLSHAVGFDKSYVNFMPPEVLWKPFEACMASDFYQLGLMIYLMLMGKSPYRFNGNLFDLVKEQISKGPWTWMDK